MYLAHGEKWDIISSEFELKSSTECLYYNYFKFNSILFIVLYYFYSILLNLKTPVSM